MPTVKANGITLYYEQQGSGEPLILIPYLAADHACYAFQVAEYAKHFTCIALDLRGSGESDKSAGSVSLELYADDVAALMQAIGIQRAHVTGLSLGAGVGMWLAAKYPDKVKSLSVHSGWTKTDEYLRTIIEGWQVLARALNDVQEMVIRGMFPWCLSPNLYTTRYEYVRSLADFVRSRPPLSVEGFIQQSNAVLAHDVEAQLTKITAPTQITLGRHDQLTSLRFAGPLNSAIKNSELVVFETASHAAIYEAVEEFNQRTLAFLQSHADHHRASA